MAPNLPDARHAREPSRSGTGGGQEVAVRIGAFLFLSGAALTVLATILPHSSQLQVAGYWADAAFQVLAAAVVLTLPGRQTRSAWVPGLTVVAGIAAVTAAATYFNGERLGGPPGLNELFYVWPAFYLGYFFRPRGIAAALLLIALAYGGVLAAMGVTGTAWFTRWVVTVAVVAGAATALRALRRHSDGLVGRLREAARTDPLTMLLNRRGFEERFELELERARRTGSPLAVLVGDLDRFKALNDRFGHPAGDMALAGAARALAAGCRAIDTVARIGGEEFALLLPDTDAAGALDVAGRLREELAGVVDGDGRPLTISFGLAEYPTHGQGWDDLVRAADGAMYAAKAMGRDRTVVHGAERAVAIA